MPLLIDNSLPITSYYRYGFKWRFQTWKLDFKSFKWT